MKMRFSIISSRNKNIRVRVKMLQEVVKLHFKIFERRLWDLIFLASLVEWLMGSRKYELFIAYFKNTPVGFCLMRESRIWQIGVLKEYRRLGIGSSLVPDYATVVRTPKFRTNAIKFYEKLGFKKKKETKRSIWLERS
ncbi:MAG: hypothetical protein DRP08_07685 [Candidatus Aenigmatarchaeota archaeon]|nr:MAG: hypothetical protein DRP08_07685 [Candidatus Aenigmarchaeota archaeon]